MIKLRLAFVAVFITLPLAAGADITVSGLPDNTVWYMHADLEEMRDTESGSQIYKWFEGEVVVEINDELGIDLNSEVNSITAFSASKNGTVIVIDGPLTKDSRDKLLALAATEGKLDPREHGGRDYFQIGDGEDADSADNDPFNDLEDSAYFSFSLDDKAIITGNESQMKELLDNGGNIAGSGSHDGAMFVLSADKSFVQAGLRTDALTDDDDNDDWESNILRNTRQAALLVSDSSGMIAIEAKLVSTDPKMAEAIGGIVNGLIGLQAFNSELGPEIQSLIRNTKIEVNDAILSINTVIDPELVVSVLND